MSDLSGESKVGAVGVSTLDAKRLFDARGAGNGLVVGVVPDGDVGARLGKGLGHGEADSGAGAGYDGCFPGEGEERHDARVWRGGGVVPAEDAILDAVGHFRLKCD